MNNAQKVTIGVTLLLMFAISVFREIPPYSIHSTLYDKLKWIIEYLLPVMLLGGAFFAFFSLKKRKK